MSDNKPTVRMDATPPDGLEGEGFFATKLSSVIGLASFHSGEKERFATGYFCRRRY